MNLGIDGRCAPAIGGSTGPGLACCKAFAAQGVDIAIFARNRDNLKAAVESLPSGFGVRVDGFGGDITGETIQFDGGMTRLLVQRRVSRGPGRSPGFRLLE